MSLTLHGVTDKLKPDDEKYANALEIGGDAFKEVELMFADEDFHSRKGWKRDSTGDDGIVVYAKSTSKGKFVTVKTELAMDADSVINDTWNGVDGLPNWNPNIKFARVLSSPTDHFDIITYGNNDVLIVSGRDFVSARIYRKVENGYILASRSVDLPEYPEQDGKVRAQLLLAGAWFRPKESDPTRTTVDVIMMADLKGFIPRLIVNQVFGKIMVLDTEQNRKYFAEMRRKKDEQDSEKVIA